MGSSNQFLMMIYKGFLLRKCHFIITALEVLVPLLGLFYQLYLVSKKPPGLKSHVLYSPAQFHNATFYEPYSPFELSNLERNFTIIYTPNYDKSKQLMEKAVTIFNNNVENAVVKLIPVNTEFELEITAFKNKEDDLKVLGVVVESLFNEADDFSNILEYKIRCFEDSMSFNLDYLYSEKIESRSEKNVYRDTNFLVWQASIEQAFIAIKCGKTEEKCRFNIMMHRFPFPEYYTIKDHSRDVVIIQNYIVYGFLFFFCVMVQRVMQEKMNPSRDLFKVMGMNNFVYWSSTFFNYITLGIIISIFISSILKIKLPNGYKMLFYVDFIMIFILLIFYLISSILLYLTVTTLFKEPNFAIAFIFIVHILSHYLISVQYFQSVKSPKFGSLSLFEKLALCLLPNAALQVMFHIFDYFEKAGESIWSNMGSENPYIHFYLGYAWLMMFLSCFIYAFLLWYLDHVWPWQLGTPKKFYFMFTKTFWFGFPYEYVRIENIMEDEYFEEDPKNIAPIIIIRNLSKTFVSGFVHKKALDNISVNIYPGQITAFLGQTGCGKSTIMNILTGLFLPCCGFASINGYNIRTQPERARERLGICPQHNMLYESLTVEEHLTLYAMLKDVECKDLKTEVSKIISIIHLDKAHKVQAKNLSGGMKRKLCLGMALIGGSKILFLDEPTSGIDPEGRRALWDILLQLRTDHTIILTTSCMEEADKIADRVVFLTKGIIHSFGSPMFLKKTFGTGYHIHFEILPNCKVSAITEFLKTHLQNSVLECETDDIIIYSLGVNACGDSLLKVLIALEKKKNSLFFQTYEISVTTMDEVFLRIAVLADEDYGDEDEEEEGKKKVNDEIKAFIDNLPDTEPFILHYEKLNATNLLYQQVKGLLKKSIHYYKHHWRLLIFQISAPLVLAFPLFGLIRFIMFSSRTDSLKLYLASVFGSTTGVFNFSDSLNDSFNDSLSNFLTYYKNTLKESEVEVRESDDITQDVLYLGKEDRKMFQRSLSIGGEFTEDLNITAWYNGEPYHILPMALNLMHEGLLKYFTSNSTAVISLTNEPFFSPYLNIGGGIIHRNIIFVFTPIFLPFMIAVWTASYMRQPIEECVTRVKLLQLMTGISSFTYWMTMFCCDIFIHSIVIFLLIIPILIFLSHLFFTLNALSGFVLLFLLFGWSILPICYILSLFIEKPVTGFTIISSYVLLTGIALGFIFSAVFVTFSESDHGLFYKIGTYVSQLNPCFCIVSGFSKLLDVSYSNIFCSLIPENILERQCNSTTNNSYFIKCCSDICKDDCFNQINPIAWGTKGCSKELIFLFIDGIIYFSILFIFESGFLQKCFSKIWDKLPWKKRVSDDETGNELITVVDSDIQHEKHRVQNLDYDGLLGEALTVEELTKWYGGFCAVDHISFGVHQKECFGLLGANGAGKSTTFRMLAGDLFPTEGNAFIQDDSIEKNLKRFQMHIGYCPEFDPLINSFTAREMLHLFAHLRGIPSAVVKTHINYLIDQVDLKECADSQISTYSAGNKRKLSLLLAVIGNPPLILLDEPSAGLDPISKRKIWKVLENTRKFVKSTIILCTHNMEECEAVCSRLAIMVNGQFQCFGTLQHLRDKYGLGYTAVIKLKKDQFGDKEIKNSIVDEFNLVFPNSCLKEDRQGVLTFHIVTAFIPWSTLFKTVEQMKIKFDFEDYLVSGTTLEQIFLMFANMQK